MADNTIVQTIKDAEIDARSLSEFVFKPSGFKVARRLAPPINTLQFYIDRFNSLNGDFSSSVSVALSSLNNSVAEAEGKVTYIETTVQDAITEAVTSSGFVTIDSFELGATITQRNQALRHGEVGRLYRWAGDLPKVVPLGSTPASTGGSGANAWIEVSDATLSSVVAVKLTSLSNINELQHYSRGILENVVLVESRAGNSGYGGGKFRWVSGAVPEVNNITTFDSKVDLGGYWERVLVDNFLDDTMFGDTPQAAADAIEYATSNKYNLNITGLLSGRPDGIYYIDGTIKAGIEDGQTTKSVLRGDVTFRPSAEGGSLFLECRNWKGEWDGDVEIQGMDRIDTGVSFYNCQSFTCKSLKVTATAGWGIKYDGGNNNSFKIDTIAVERCGSKGVSACNITIPSSGSVSFQRATIECTLPEDTEIIDIDGNIRRVVEQTDTYIKVFPGLPESTADIKELTYYRGGGLKVRGADGGLLVCQYFRSIANIGISLCMQSLYGALIHKAVFELDKFIAIVIGQSPTSIHYKTTIVDAYFENTYPITILQVYQQSYLDILNGLGVRPGGNVNIREFIQNKAHWGNTDAISTVKLHRTDQSPYENTDEYLQNYMHQSFSRSFTESLNTLFDVIGTPTDKTLNFKINTTDKIDSIRATRLKILNATNKNIVEIEFPEGSVIRAYSGVVMKEGVPTTVYTQGSNINEFEIYRLRNDEWIIHHIGNNTEDVFVKSFEDVTIVSKESSIELVIASGTAYRPTDFLTATTSTDSPLLFEKVYAKSNGDICATGSR